MVLNNEYFFKIRMQPTLSCMLDSLNIKEDSKITALYLQYFGNAFNASELAQNVDPNVFFLNCYTIMHNVEGANRTMSMFLSGGKLVYNGAIITTGTSLILTLNTPPFQYLRVNNAGGFPANALTTITFCGYRIKI